MAPAAAVGASCTMVNESGEPPRSRVSITLACRAFRVPLALTVKSTTAPAPAGVRVNVSQSAPAGFVMVQVQPIGERTLMFPLCASAFIFTGSGSAVTEQCAGGWVTVTEADPTVIVPERDLV